MRHHPSRRGLLGAGALGAVTLATARASAAVARFPATEAGEILDVVIVGAGLAGLTAARDLDRAGNRSFAVLEARGRVGGRTFNHQLRGGYISEGGGQWIGPGQTAVADLARELDIGTFDSVYRGKAVYNIGDGFLAVDTDGGLDMSPALVGAIDRLAQTVPSGTPWTARNAAAWDRLSMADWLASQNVSDIDRLTWRLASILTAGTSISKVSFLYYLSLLNSSRGVQGLEGQRGGAQQTRFVGGSQIISIKMVEALRDFVHLDHPVTQIADWDKGVTAVHTPARIFRARRVIMALSPPLCAQIAFTPALPRARSALQQRWPAYAPMAKCAMVYASPFWFDSGYNAQVACMDGPVIWSYDNSPPDMKIGVINAFLRAGDVPSDRDQAQRLIASIYSRAMDDERLLRPQEFHVLDWAQEPYTITCVSPMPPGFLTGGLMPALTQNLGGLIWAGTETAQIWNGYMDGAVRSGHTAALEALQGLAAVRTSRS
ncbi:MAG: FAD-dependent oxidoreductase [Pseudomonadota bacterium]|nr:FAD-dependent oxidoreductase [Pseudomonadota bacterium]